MYVGTFVRGYNLRELIKPNKVGTNKNTTEKPMVLVDDTLISAILS